MKSTTVFKFAAAALVLTAAPAFGLDEKLAELAPACVVDVKAPFEGSALVRMVDLESDLNNVKENPAILDRSARGTFQATVRFERTSAATALPTRAVVRGRFQFAVDQTETITAAHFHTGVAGVNGAIVIPLNPQNRFDVSPGTDGVILTQFEVSDLPSITTLLNIASDPELFYVNVHSSARPGGIIRGQVRNALAGEPDCLRSAVGAVGGELAAVHNHVTDAKEDARAQLRLMILIAAQTGVIGGAERDQMLKLLGF